MKAAQQEVAIEEVARVLSAVYGDQEDVVAVATVAIEDVVARLASDRVDEPGALRRGASEAEVLTWEAAKEHMTQNRLGALRGVAEGERRWGDESIAKKIVDLTDMRTPSLTSALNWLETQGLVQRVTSIRVPTTKHGHAASPYRMLGAGHRMLRSLST